jgi:hypothetical protein
LIELLKKQIKPYQEFWQLVVDWQKNKTHWETTVLRTLVPDDVEKDHKKMRADANRLSGYFEREKITKPLSVAKNLFVEID